LKEIEDIYGNKQKYAGQRAKVKTIEFPTRKRIAEAYSADYSALGRPRAAHGASLRNTLARMRAYDTERVRCSLAGLKGIKPADIRTS
jgi:hypothetical protein